MKPRPRAFSVLFLIMVPAVVDPQGNVIMEGKNIVKTIIVPGKIINFIAK